MSVHQLSLPQLQTLVNNQEECSDLPPVTMRATFKLSRILELIAEVVSNPAFKPDDDYTHNICITFVRQEVGKNELDFFDHRGLDKYSDEKNGRRLTQVIPIITGCIAEFADKEKIVKNKNNEDIKVEYKDWISFEYLRNGNGIPYLRPGGETSGLIPPPPPNDHKFS